MRNWLAGAAIVVTLVAVHASHGPAHAARSQTTTVTLTGCLRQGSTAAVFVLRGAVAAKSQEPPRDHLIVRPAAGIDLGGHLNQQVAVTGPAWRAADGPAPPEGANTVERALRRVEAQKLEVVADRCSAG